MSADDQGIHNASCENGTPCVFPSQVWHQLISPEAVLMGHLIYNAYIDHSATFVYRIKLPRHVENVIMMINNAGNVFTLCISTTKTQALQ